MKHAEDAFGIIGAVVAGSFWLILCLLYGILLVLLYVPYVLFVGTPRKTPPLNAFYDHEYPHRYILGAQPNTVQRRLNYSTIAVIAMLVLAFVGWLIAR